MVNISFSKNMINLCLSSSFSSSKEIYKKKEDQI